MSKSFSSALSVVWGIFLYVLFSSQSVFAQAATLTRFDSQSAFISENQNPTIVSYDSFPNARFATYEQTFATEGVKIKPNDPGYTNPLYVNDWSALLPGKEFAITGKEWMEFNFTTPVNAFGYDFVELTACIPWFCPTTFIESTFVISIYTGATKIGEYTFTPANDVASFFGVSSSQTFDKVIIQETVGGVDDELYGKLYISRSAPTPVCGNPRAQVNFVPYTGIPVADQNSSTNAWDSITLGNKAVIPGGTFFDITDGTNPIDDGTIVSTGLQNFAVSRHNGYIEFLALGRRLTTYYGYYQGTIKFQNVQVDRVEWGLTTATWADIGLEPVEGDTVTKVSDTEVSFKLAFANQGDGFRVYLKNPTPTPCTCPAGQEKKPDPKSPVCIVRARVDGVQDTTVTLTGYNHLVGNCTVAGIVPQAPQTPSPDLVVTAGQQRVGWTQSSPWTFQLDPLLTCPAGTTKTACIFTYGAGPLGEITCGCYPNGYTTKTFTNPTVQGRPVYSRDGSPAQFCREQWYTERALVKNVENFVGAWSLWNWQSWEINQNLEIIKEVECSNEPNTVCKNFYEPRVHGKPVFARNASPAQFCREQGYAKSATVNKEYSYEGNGSLWNGSVWEINLNLAAIREVNCCKLEDKPSDICVASGCAVGQYWCQSENICKPAGQTCGAVTCNNNNTCEAGESCNCGDCTNGGTDDADKCGLSGGAQMVCTKDVKNTTTTVAWSTQKWIAYTYPGLASSYIYLTQLPAPSYTVNGKTFIVYDPVRIIKGMSKATFLADPATAIKNAPVIPLGAARDKRVTFNLAQLQAETPTVQSTVIDGLSSSVNRLKYLCTQSMVNAPECDSNSAGSWVPSFGYSENGSIYVSASGGSTNVSYVEGEKIGIFDASVDATCQPYTTSSLQYIPNTDPRTQGWLNINGIGTAQNDAGKLVWQVNDGGNDTGDNAVVYKKFSTTELGDFFTRGGKYSVELKNISASAPTSWAAYLLASYLEIARGANTTKGARRFTFVFGLDAYKTPTIIGLTSNGTTYTTPSNSTYKYRVDGGANKYNTYDMVYDPATDTVDMFVNGVERISNFPGNTVVPGYATAIRDTAAIIFGSGTSPWVANTNYGNIAVSIRNNCPGSSVQVGACCPAGSQWDSSQGKCLAACEPIVTLKKGSELTTIKNTLNESFSANTTCANKNISLSPCNTTTGVVADGTSPSGNKLYKWPKAASWLSKDYNLVEINGQCWFADNLEEKPSAVPTPPGAWDNFAPHNDYGVYSYTGTGVNRPEWYLYQFDAATNMVAPGGAPLDRQQGVCPAGWHVATDCEFQYLEHTLGMSVAQQQSLGARGTNVWPQLLVGGGSWFDLTLSGNRRFNTGFNDGGSRGDLWSTECLSSGCYKRMYDIAGNIIRDQWGQNPNGTYDSAHHAAGSVRCVKDGSTTPVNTCPVPWCGEGEYYCHAELKCKAAGSACGTVTCNYNNVCDTNESCDCADCNEKVDHCGLTSTGEQMICTKDTAPTCYTDKFPYCLSGCLDGYTMDTNGQCIPTIPLGVPQNCSVRSVQGIEWSVALCDAGEVRVGGGCENTNGGAYRFFTFPLIKGENWWNYTNIAQDGWACGSGSTGTYTKAYAVCCTAPTTGTYNLRKGTPGIGSKAECLAGEVRTGGGCKNLGWSAYLPVSYPLAAGSTFGSLGAVTYDGWGCATGASDTTTEAYAICYAPGTGPSFQTTIRTKIGTELAMVECQPDEVRTGGGCSLITWAAYHYAIFPSTAGVFNGYGTATNDGFVCASGSTGTYTQAYAVCASKANTITTANNGSQSFTYPVKIDGYVKNDTASATKFCTEKWFTSATIVSSDSSGARKMGWNGTAWVADNSGGSYIKLLTCFGGTPQNYTCKEYTGNIQAHGGYLSIQPQSTTQFCKEAGYDFPQLTAQYSTSSSCRLWNGTSWYEDVACVAASGLQCCQNPVAQATPTEPQLWACCPPGSAWNSTENRCIPTTCGEGQFYCAAQKKCLAGGQTCDTAVCNNDGVCSGEESCQCADCVNGGGDDKDKCSIVWGVQAMCSDDNPSDGKPGACCVPPKKWNSTTNTCVECSNTQAPSELKAGVDQPYITCTGNGDTTKTHFRYRITEQGARETPFISEPFTIGTQVLHPTMTLGNYTVECFYGNATGVDTSTTAAPHSCVKTMSVKSDAQGCSRVYPYKENTLSDEMISSNAFDASFRCGSRKPVLGTVTNPYMFRVGTQAASYLSFDALISELFNGLTIWPVSIQTQNYAFNTGNTDVTCATKVGGGYSTNTACQLRTCVGGACNVPQTFSVVHSDDLICTTEETSKYNIGCNPAAPDSVRNQCIQWFRDAVNAGSRSVPNGVEFNVSFVFNGDAPTNVKCIKYVAGQMPGGLNLSDNVVCSADLKNGERYQIYAADTNGRIDALQTTAKTVERDSEKPSMADIKYYTDESLTTEVIPTNWYNKPVIALAVCSDTPLNEATSCACAQRVDVVNTTDADAWSLGVPNSLIGADLMRYTRTITETLTGTQKVQVIDTAGNTSSPKNIAVSLDTQVPLVTPSESGTGATKTITLTASDTGSKIWKTTTAPSGATNSNGIIYRVGLKADMANLAFNAECNTTATYASVAETQATSFASQAVATIPNINTATQVVAYCVRDNAGNTTRGMYPVVTDACFSASNMSTIPNLDTYKALLKTRLTATGTDNQKYGYSFSENTADANCFRGILWTNITTLMANQLKPRTSTTLSNWDRDRAELSTSTTLSNGYYYYVYPTSNTLNIVTSPSGGAPVKSVVVEGGDIRIKTDINYSGAGKTLLLIARKNSNGQGGNIIIDTNVRNIDAILIADGGALRSSDATLPGERLTINGRVYSYNTRGGSLAISGTDFIDATTPKKFTNSSLVSASSLNDARIQDLERFRPIFADGNKTCSLTVNYTTFTTVNLPALLKRPNTFTGGSCGF